MLAGFYYWIFVGGLWIGKGYGDECVDRVHNLIRAESDRSSKLGRRKGCGSLDPKPAMIYNFSAGVYDRQNSPSCYKKRPTVVLPGSVKFLTGRNL